MDDDDRRWVRAYATLDTAVELYLNGTITRDRLADFQAEARDMVEHRTAPTA